MNRLVKIGISTLLSGGILSHESLGGYVSDAVRRSLGIGLAHFQDGAVHYFGKDVNLLKRGLVQTAHQLAYGALRSYPRYIKYWEQTVRDKHLKTNSQTSAANKSGQYFQLIQNQKAARPKKNYTDTIVGNVVVDYLELSAHDPDNPIQSAPSLEIEEVDENGEATQRKIDPRLFIDLQPVVQVTSKNNVVLTTVQGRDFSRKELISGGDLEISISGKITSKYPELYPEGEVSKFIKLMQFRGVLNCDNTILRQFNISQLIVLNYSLGTSDCRNIQPYTLQCVAVEPSEAVEIKPVDAERVDRQIAATNKWIKWVRLGAEVVDPASLLKISRLWL